MGRKQGGLRHCGRYSAGKQRAVCFPGKLQLHPQEQQDDLHWEDLPSLLHSVLDWGGGGSSRTCTEKAKIVQGRCLTIEASLSKLGRGSFIRGGAQCKPMESWEVKWLFWETSYSTSKPRRTDCSGSKGLWSRNPLALVTWKIIPQVVWVNI